MFMCAKKQVKVHIAPFLFKFLPLSTTEKNHLYEPEGYAQK